MSSMRATPPFHPPSEEEEVIGQDNAAWANDKREGLKETPSPSSHDQPHPDELQPTREKLTDAEWENVVPAAMVRCELCTELRNWPYLILRYVAITQFHKTNLVSVCTQCTHSWHSTHKTSWNTCRGTQGVQILMHNDDCAQLNARESKDTHTLKHQWSSVVCVLQAVLQAAQWGFSSGGLEPLLHLISTECFHVCVYVCWGVSYLASGSVGP